jgi:adenine-specific DNA-methyltransferase
MAGRRDDPPQTIPGLVRAFRQWARSEPAAVNPDVSGASPQEQHLLGALGGIAEAVCGPGRIPGPDEVGAWAASGPIPPPRLVEAVRGWLGREQEPLSHLYNGCVSAAHRRFLGTVFTPDSVVEHMLSLAERQLGGAPAVVVDPGAGVGAFTIAAARRWPKATVIAIDINVVTLGLLATRIAFEIDADPDLADILSRVDLRRADYLDEVERLFAPDAQGPVLACGNPPYTRIQSLLPSEKAKAAAAAGTIIDSGHANLAMVFQAATLRLMREADASCMVLPGSFVYTRASRGLRRSLWLSRRPVIVHRWRATTRAFIGRSVQAAVLAIGPGQDRRSPLRLARAEMGNRSVQLIESWTLSRSEPPPENWYWPGPPAPVDGDVLLSELARVRRGTATGANQMFFLTDEIAATLPDDVVVPGVLTLRGFDGLVLDGPAHARLAGVAGREPRRWLLAIPPERKLAGALQTYVTSFKEEVALRHLAANRARWYSLDELPRPQILVSPLSKKSFKVVLNPAEAVPSNNLYGIDLLNGGDPRLLADWLRSPSGQAELRRVSRRYPGGSNKLEPSDVRSVLVPSSLRTKLQESS